VPVKARLPEADELRARPLGRLYDEWFLDVLEWASKRWWRQVLVWVVVFIPIAIIIVGTEYVASGR
jgi:hypothetical protein